MSSNETRDEGSDLEAAGETAVLCRYGGDRRVFELRDEVGQELVVGRARECGFVADDDRLSRRHLRLWVEEGVVWAEDLGSRNGSTLNGKRLIGRKPLQPGDELVAGPVRLVVGGRRGGRGMLDETELSARLHSEVQRALRFRRPFAVIGLRLSGPASGRREAAMRVAASLAPTDVVGEYTPGVLLVLLPEVALGRAETLAEELARGARDVSGVEAAAAAAAVPESGVSADALLARALGTDEPTRAATDQLVVVAEEPATRALWETVRRAAQSEMTVLVVGETGAGKELVAAELHRAGTRANGPYIKLNCASLSESLLESELFGHERGAFTGADRRRIGFIESASGGTLFLDEVGELSLMMQAKLLRVLEDHRITRVGGTQEVTVDVRFVAATNRDLEAEVTRGGFRLDLFFRLSALVLKVAPLRERQAEILPLAEHFARAAAARARRPAPQLTRELGAALRRYPWPGNVRELRNVMERAVVLADGDLLGPGQLPQRFSAVIESAPVGKLPEQVDALERQSLDQALRETNGNRTHAARKLGISRRALLYKLKKHGL